jgi:phytoene/squalene synthetase
VRRLVADLVGWARSLMRRGAPLVHAIPGRAGWELRLVIQGGLRILEKIEQMDFATLLARPRLTWRDAPLVVWRALCMRPADASMASETP